MKVTNKVSSSELGNNEETVVGYIGIFDWENDAAEIIFDGYVVSEKNQFMTKKLTDDIFSRQFYPGKDQVFHIHSLRIEQFRKPPNTNNNYSGRAYVKKEGCSLENNTKRKDNISRRTIGGSLFLEERLYKAIFEKYYNANYHENISLKEIKPDIEIEDNARRAFYKLPKIDKEKAMDFYINHNQNQVNEWKYFELIQFLGGFYNDYIQIAEWERLFHKTPHVIQYNQIAKGFPVDYSRKKFLLLEEYDYLFEIRQQGKSASLELKHMEKRNDGSISYKPDEKIEKDIEDEVTRKLIHGFFSTKEYMDLLNMNSHEIQILTNAIKEFLPGNCNKSWIKGWLEDITKSNNVRAIEENPFGGEYDLGSAEKMKELNHICKARTDKQLSGEQVELSDELHSLFISISQNPITVIVGGAGTGNGVLCHKLCDNLKCSIETKSPYKEDRVLVEEHYRIIEAKSDWYNRTVFESWLKESDGHNSFNMLEILSGEARCIREIKNSYLLSIPFILCIKNATAASIEKYLEDFIDLRRNWYNTSECQRLGHTQYLVPKNFRIVLQISDDPKGILSEELLKLVSVVEPHNPSQLIKELEGVSYSNYFRKNTPRFFDGPSDFKRTWDTDEYSTYKEIYQKICKILEKNVELNNGRICIDSFRIDGAVSRHWYAMLNVNQDTKSIRDRTEILELVPDSLVIDDECISDESVETDRETVALDYALAQHVIPCLTKVRGSVTVHNMTDIVEFLVKNHLYHCMELIKKAIDNANIKIADELSDASNSELIIKKCNAIHSRLLEENGFEGDDIVEHICNLINLCRDKDVYTRNVIVNMLICISQGFLTVFSGKPGCGKTSISRIIGESLGLTNYNEMTVPEIEFNKYEVFQDRRKDIVDPCRYLEVSTERGWTSKRDFIGYYNPLTEQFDKANALLYNAFMVMDNEAREDENDRKEKKDAKKRLPCLILLDEANLSAMEYYWADFMNLCEAEWRESNAIDLGGGKIFKIPETLHFIATINNDHTTEILSPRLIDRANVIDLPVAELKEINKEAEDALEIKSISWDILKKNFCPDESKRKKEWEEYKRSFAGDFNPFEVYEKIKKEVEKSFSLSISPRTEIAVSRYYYVASALFEGAEYTVAAQLNSGDSFNEILSREKEAEYQEDDLLRLIKVCIKGNGRSLPEEDDNIDEKVGSHSAEQEELKLENNDKKIVVNYENRRVKRTTQAIDYAIAQRILPKLTDVSGDNAFRDLKELLRILLNESLYKSAGIVADLIGRGFGSGFYNYFR